MESPQKPQELQNVLTTSLKVDRNPIDDLGIIKEELRKVNALKFKYTTYEGDAFMNVKQ